MTAIILEDLPKTRKEAIETGSRHYFTGKPCKHGHVSVRNIYGACMECSIETATIYVANNYDKVSNRKRKHYVENIEKISANKRAYRVANRDKIKEYNRKYRHINNDAIKESTIKYRSRNFDIVRERNRLWKSKNTDRVKVHDHNMRARRASAEGSHTVADIIRIRDSQKDKCGYCGMKLKGGGHVDHIIALARGGSNSSRNLQLLCAPCNRSKSARDPIEFAKSLGMLV